MKRPVLIITWTFILTVIVVVLYIIYLFNTVAESATLGIPFSFVVLLGLALFTESIIFALIFYKRLATTWTILLPVFLLTSIIPIYLINNWCSNRPIEVPLPGQLTVSIDKYKADSKLVVGDYFQTEIDSNNVNIWRDTIQTAFIDTIIYSLDKTNFFAIIICVINDNDQLKYCSNYRVGNLVSGNWQLKKPAGNIWSTCFESIDKLKYELRQYYYKKYSINNSSDKPEIWTDKYIFNFEIKSNK